MNMYNFSRRDFLKTIGLTTAALATPGCLRAAVRSKAKPNIILIMVDDMGYSDIGCFGAEIQTPNIDRLAAQGVRFTQFYNAARCCPTRASLMTGLYPHQAGMGGMVSTSRSPGPYQGYLNDKCVTIAEVLTAAGYTTLMSGKWHIGEMRPHWPTDRGFKKYFGLINGAANYFDITKGKHKGAKRQMALDDQPYTPPREGFYITDAFSDHAVKFLDLYGRNDKPFFMYVAYTAPHWPLHALSEDIAKYRGKYRKGWDIIRKERYDRMLKIGIIDGKRLFPPRDEEVVLWDEVENKDLMDYKMAVYAAQIDRVDQGIGKIMAKLEEIDKSENTLILFLSDNGGCHEGGRWGFDNRKNGLPPGGVDSYMSYGRSWANMSNTPFRMFKHWVHEGGIATPLIAHWPARIKQHGTITNQPGHIIDIMATCCDVAGATYPKIFKGKEIIPLEGKSLLTILLGGKRQGHDELYWEHMGNRAIRQGKWKLVSKKNAKWELYDLAAERTELHDLTKKHPNKIKELAALYDTWARRCGVNQKVSKKKS